MRRFLALFLSLIMILSIVVIPTTVAAAETAVATVDNFILGENTEMTADKAYVAFDEVGDSVTTTVKVETAGDYWVGFYGGGLIETEQNIGAAAYVDGLRVASKKFDKADSKPASVKMNDYYLGVANLSQGVHTIRIENLEGQYKIETVKVMGDATAPTESSCLVRYSDWPGTFTMDGGNTNTKFVMFRSISNMNGVVGLTVPIGVQEDGLYELSWDIRKGSWFTLGDMKVKAIIDGVEYDNLSSGNQSASSSSFDKQVLKSNIPLTAGNHTVKLESVATSDYYYYILNVRLTKTAELPTVTTAPEAESFISSTGTATEATDGDKTVVSLAELDTVTYAVETGTNGSYSVNLTLAPTIESEKLEYFRVSMKAGDSETYKAYRRPSDETATLGSYRTFNIGNIDLKKGVNFVTLKNLGEELSEGAFKLDSLSFTLSKAYENVNELIVTDTSVATGGVSYDLYAPYDGYYKLTAKAKASQNSLLVVATALGESAPMAVKSGSTAQSYYSILRLRQGKNTLKFTADSSVTLNSIKVECPDYVGNGIGEQLNSAKTNADVQKILGDNKDKILVDLDKTANGVLNKEPIYAGMINQNFKDFREVTNALSQLIFNNLSAPDVALKKNGIAIKALQSGNLSVEVDTKFVGAGKVLAALYKDGKLQIAKSANAGSTKTTLPLGNVTISEGSWELKVFCFTSLDQLKPVAMFTNQKTIYVKANGNDAKDGSSWDNAVGTIERAQELARELVKTATGDVVVEIGSGVFTVDSTLNFTTADSGKNGKVIYRGSDSGETVISGGTKVTGWTQSNIPNVYVADTDVLSARTLYVNDLPAQRARSKYVYEGLEEWEDTTDSVAVGDKHKTDGFTVSKHNFPILEKPEDAELVWRMLWVQQRTPVKDIVDNGSTKLVKMDQPYWDWATTSLNDYTKPQVEKVRTYEQIDESGNVIKAVDQKAKLPFYIENDLNLLDEEGEFYFDKDTGKVYYYPFAEEKSEFDSGSAKTYLGTTEILMKVQGDSKTSKVRNLTFENLSFKYGAWNEASTTGIRTGQADKMASGPYQMSEVSGGRMLPAQLQFNFANNIEILDCEFSCLGSGAISMVDGVSNSRIEGNSFHDISGTGVIVSTWDNGKYMYERPESEKPHNIEIANNMFRRTAYEFTDKCGVSVYYADNVNIHHNYFKDLPYTAITAGWGWQTDADVLDKASCYNLKVQFNKFENIMQMSSDGGAVYMLGQMINAYVSDNYINGAKYGNGGIYFDGGSSHGTAENNVVMNVPKWLKKNPSGTLNIAKNNFTNMTESEDYDSNHPAANIKISGTTYMTTDISNYSKAVEIRDNSGLSSEFAYLAEDLDLPTWRTDLIKAEPTYRFNGECTWIDVRNWADTSYENGPREYRMEINEHNKEIVLSNNGWTAYKITVPNDGYYNLSIETASAGADRTIKLFISDDLNYTNEKEILNYPIETQYPGDYVSYIYEHTEPIYLTKGEKIIRAMGSQLPIHLGPFKFDDGVERTKNDAAFDDGRVTQN